MTIRRADEGVIPLRTDDQGAVADLYARWSPFVYSLALRCLTDVGDAEEVTRRVFAEASVSRGMLDETSSRLGTRLSGLARRAIAEVRAERHPGQSVEDESKTAVLAERLLVAAEMARLDAVSQQLLGMALAERLSHAEIAERTGLPVEEVRRQIVSSLIELRRRTGVTPDAR